MRDVPARGDVHVLFHGNVPHEDRAAGVVDSIAESVYAAWRQQTMRDNRCYAVLPTGAVQRLFLPDVRCYLMLLLLAFVGIGVALSKNPDPVQLNRLVEFAKIIGIALFTTAVVQTREHLRVLIWVIACSFAFYGVKSGVWGVLTGGATAIKQGPGGMLADNNDFSLAMAMAVPILVHVGLSERREILRKAFLYSVPLTIITVALTHSRGGFLALAGGSSVLIWHSRSRVAAGLLAFFVASLAVIVAPPEYKERSDSRA